MSDSKRPKEWSREEMVILVVEYFRTKPLGTSKNRQSIRMISELLRSNAENEGMNISSSYRNENGIYKQMACVAHFDPEEQAKGHVNLTNGSSLLEQVTKDYLLHPNEVVKEAYESIVGYFSRGRGKNGKNN